MCWWCYPVRERFQHSSSTNNCCLRNVNSHSARSPLTATVNCPNELPIVINSLLHKKFISFSFTKVDSNISISRCMFNVTSVRTQSFYTFDKTNDRRVQENTHWPFHSEHAQLMFEKLFISAWKFALHSAAPQFFFSSTIKITYWQRHATQRKHILSLTKYGALAMIHTARKFSQFRLTTSFRCRYRTRILEQKTFSLAVKIMFLCCILYGSVLPSRFTTSRKKREKTWLELPTANSLETATTCS